MELLTALVTLEGQMMLDPFMDSGTTCLRLKGSIGATLRLDAENIAIAKERLGLEQDGKQSHQQQLLLSAWML